MLPYKVLVLYLFMTKWTYGQLITDNYIILVDKKGIPIALKYV